MRRVCDSLWYTKGWMNEGKKGWMDALIELQGDFFPLLLSFFLLLCYFSLWPYYYDSSLPSLNSIDHKCSLSWPDSLPPLPPPHPHPVIPVYTNSSVFVNLCLTLTFFFFFSFFFFLLLLLLSSLLFCPTSLFRFAFHSDAKAQLIGCHWFACRERKREREWAKKGRKRNKESKKGCSQVNPWLIHLFFVSFLCTKEERGKGVYSKWQKGVTCVTFCDLLCGTKDTWVLGEFSLAWQLVPCYSSLFVQV